MHVIKKIALFILTLQVLMLRPVSVYAVSPSSNFEVSPLFRVTQFKSTDSSTDAVAQLFSSYNAGFELGWRINWNEKVSTRLHLGLGQAAFKPSAVQNTSVSTWPISYQGFGLGGQYRINSKLYFLGQANYEDFIFVRAITAGNILAETVTIPALLVGGGYNFVDVYPFTFGFKFLAGFHAPANTDSYSARVGSDIRSSLYFIQGKISKPKFEAELGMRLIHQNTSFSRQQQLDVGVTIKFFFPTEIY